MSYTLTPVASPPPYFMVTATATVHRVRRAVEAVWRGAAPGTHTSYDFACRGMSVGGKGRPFGTVPPGATVCARCAGAPAIARKGHRPRPATRGTWGLL